jgi:hypothetical protein
VTETIPVKKRPQIIRFFLLDMNFPIHWEFSDCSCMSSTDLLKDAFWRPGTIQILCFSDPTEPFRDHALPPSMIEIG